METRGYNGLIIVSSILEPQQLVALSSISGLNDQCDWHTWIDAKQLTQRRFREAFVSVTHNDWMNSVIQKGGRDRLDADYPRVQPTIERNSEPRRELPAQKLWRARSKEKPRLDAGQQ
jgi:hypothetical protein